MKKKTGKRERKTRKQTPIEREKYDEEMKK
jgi:hypothetical protein